MNCRYCDGDRVIKHGTRKTGNGPVQIYLCRDCQRVFSDSVIPYMNTREALVLRGISLYNQGYSLGQCSRMLMTSFGERIPRNTLHYWTTRYQDVFPYIRMRKKIKGRIPIYTRIYGDMVFAVHRRKIDLISPEMRPLRRYIGTVIRGLKGSHLQRGDLESTVDDRFDHLVDSARYVNGSTQSRILKMAIRAEELDPLRHILINDSISVCRNLPLHMKHEGKEYRGFSDILQADGDRITLLSMETDDLGSISNLRSLLTSAMALSKRARVPLKMMRIGAFDTEKMWTLDLETALGDRELMPKSN